MATWAQVVAAEPEAAAAFLAVVDQVVRPNAAAWHEVLRDWEWLYGLYNDPAHPFRIVLNALDADAAVPNSGGLAGATATTKTDLLAQLSPIPGLLTDHNSDDDKQRRRRLAGINAR